jgi:hypothetical protein
MRSLHPLLVLVFAGLILAAIQPLSAQVVQHDRKVSNFENVVISTSENTYVHISYDRSHKITVKADGRHVQKIKTTVTGDTLNVYLDPQEVGNAKVEIYIRLPKVRRVVIAGSGQVNVIDGTHPEDVQASQGQLHRVS